MILLDAPTGRLELDIVQEAMINAACVGRSRFGQEQLKNTAFSFSDFIQPAPM